MARGGGTRGRRGPLDSVLRLLRRPDYRPVPLRQLLEAAGVPRGQWSEVRRAVRALLRDGTLLSLPGRRLALDRDRDRIARERVQAGARRAGEGQRIRPARPGKWILGVFQERERAGFVRPFRADDGSFVGIPGSFRMGARDGDAVAVLPLRGSAPDRPAEGKIVDVLGPLSRPGVDARVVALLYGLPTAFPENVLEAAAALPQAVPKAEAAKRERFDDPAPVTIDGETARDFDDAIAVREIGGGRFRLWVHIADVGVFVRPGDVIDREARSRGTSVYFPDRVFPMLPERLSNDLCSLRPDEDRLVQSVVIDFDGDGKPGNVRFADGVIRSAARLTYAQVAETLEDGTRPAGVPAKVVPMLRAADRLRAVLESRRKRRGSIDFDLPEPVILLDVEGLVTGIRLTPRNRAHRLIEEFMLAANEAVAGWLEGRGTPCLFRIHDQPDPLKIEALAEVARGFGRELAKRGDEIRPGDIRQLLEQAEGAPEHALLSQVALRSMQQARYAPENRGHFGLAAESYAHFTSPIRRYPDLVVHRALRAARRGESLSEDDLEALGDATSSLERNAEAAEREIVAWKKVAFIRGREGERFDGIVTGVARFGIFVQLEDNLVEGLVHVEKLGGDWFDFLESRFELRGRRTGARFRLGDRVRVVVERVDPVLRRVDLGLEAVVEAASSPRRRGARKRKAR